MKRITAALLTILLLAGCSMLGIPKPSSICDVDSPKIDDLKQWAFINYNIAPWEGSESVLCDIANSNDLHLESIGNILIVADIEAIRLNAYTKQQAINVFNGFKDTLLTAKDITTKTIHDLAMQYVIQYPELILAAPYLEFLPTGNPIPIKPTDIAALLWWVDQNLKWLGSLPDTTRNAQ